MKMRWLATAALPLFATSSVTGQRNDGNATQDPAPKGRLARVGDGIRSHGQAEFDREAWRKRLGASDLDERERACDELGRIARHDDEVRKALQEWSKDEHDRDLAWTSRMLLREVDRNPLRGLRSQGSHGQNWLGSSFDFDNFSKRFEDLDSMFGDLRAEWGDMLQTLPAPSAGSSSSSQSMSLEMGPDGVTCHVTENVDGKEEKRTYTASSMDELLQAHPELRSQLGGSSFRLFHGGPDGWSGFAPRVLRFDPPNGVQGGVSENGEPPLDRLGIYCAEVGEDRTDALGLDAGVGLVVQQVQPGTIASLLGLRSGDVVVEIDGRTIHGTEDVKAALKDRAPDADVSVVVAGEDAQRRTLTWKPRTTTQKAEKKKGSRDL